MQCHLPVLCMTTAHLLHKLYAGCWSVCACRCSRCAWLLCELDTVCRHTHGDIEGRNSSSHPYCLHTTPHTNLQGVPAKQLLVLTFSRRAQGEFAARLRQRVPGGEDATVSTFHAWSWQLVRRHWREAGYARQPAVAAAEEQQSAGDGAAPKEVITEEEVQKAVEDAVAAQLQVRCVSWFQVC